MSNTNKEAVAPKNKAKYLRFYTLMTCIGQSSEKAPIRFKFEYLSTDKSKRTAYITAGSPYGEILKLEEGEKYMVLLRWNTTRNVFSILRVKKASEVAKRTVGNRLTGNFFVREIIPLEGLDHECYRVLATHDGIDFEALAYNRPNYAEGKITPQVIPYMVPEFKDGKVVYKETDTEETYMKRIAGCVIKF